MEYDGFPNEKTNQTSARDYPTDRWSTFIDQNMMNSPGHIQSSQAQASASRPGHSNRPSFVPSFLQEENLPVDFLTMQDQADLDGMYMPMGQDTTRTIMEDQNDLRPTFQQAQSSA